MKRYLLLFCVILSLSVASSLAWAGNGDGDVAALEIHDAAPLVPVAAAGIPWLVRHKFAVGAAVFVVGVIAGTVGTVYAIFSRRIGETEEVIKESSANIAKATVEAKGVSDRVDLWGPRFTNMYDRAQNTYGEAVAKVDNVTATALQLYAGAQQMFGACESGLNRGIAFIDSTVLSAFNQTRSVCEAVMLQAMVVKTTCETTVTTCKQAQTACAACQSCSACRPFP